MSQSIWDKPINQYQTKIKEYDDEIKELSLKQKTLEKRLRGLKRLKSGSNIHFIRGEKYNRYKILWLGKSYWFHSPQPKDGDEIGDEVYSETISKFLNDILSGRI